MQAERNELRGTRSDSHSTDKIIACLYGSGSFITVLKHVRHFAIFSTFQSRFTLKKQTQGALARQRSIPTKRPPLVGEISANFSG
jgi:hypothetical protein